MQIPVPPIVRRESTADAA